MSQADRSKELAIKIVEEINCPDYGMHRETEAFADFFKFLKDGIASALANERKRVLNRALKLIQERKHMWEPMNAKISSPWDHLTVAGQFEVIEDEIKRDLKGSQ